MTPKKTVLPSPKREESFTAPPTNAATRASPGVDVTGLVLCNEQLGIDLVPGRYVRFQVVAFAGDFNGQSLEEDSNIGVLQMHVKYYVPLEAHLNESFK